ncbi:hypothetical protein Y09_2536 [Brachybacterium sp. SW0106-09]|nr:hypothetical protein Y09_2536 [Brachybacterium sp. SW0106-09]
MRQGAGRGGRGRPRCGPSASDGARGAGGSRGPGRGGLGRTRFVGPGVGLPRVRRARVGTPGADGHSVRGARVSRPGVGGPLVGRGLGCRGRGGGRRRGVDPGALGVRGAEGRVTVPSSLLLGERRGFRASDRLLPVPSGPTAAAARGREGVRHTPHPRDMPATGRTDRCVGLVEVRSRAPHGTALTHRT